MHPNLKKQIAYQLFNICLLLEKDTLAGMYRKKVIQKYPESSLAIRFKNMSGAGVKDKFIDQ